MATKYLKLGEKASMFFDPFTQIKVISNQVLAIDRMPKSKKISVALGAGHLVLATESEYNAYLKKVGKTVEDAPPMEIVIPKKADPIKDELLGMTREEFVAHVKGQGFQKKDTKAVLDIEDPEEAVKEFRRIEKTYEE